MSGEGQIPGQIEGDRLSAVAASEGETSANKKNNGAAADVLLSTLYFSVNAPIRELDTPVLDTLSLER